MFAVGLKSDTKARATIKTNKDMILIEFRLIATQASVKPKPAGIASQSIDMNCHLSSMVPSSRGPLRNPMLINNIPLIIKTKLKVILYLLEKKARQPKSEIAKNKITPRSGTRCSISEIDDIYAMETEDWWENRSMLKRVSINCFKVLIVVGEEYHNQVNAAATNNTQIDQ